MDQQTPTNKSPKILGLEGPIDGADLRIEALDRLLVDLECVQSAQSQEHIQLQLAQALQDLQMVADPTIFQVDRDYTPSPYLMRIIYDLTAGLQRDADLIKNAAKQVLKVIQHRQITCIAEGKLSISKAEPGEEVPAEEDAAAMDGIEEPAGHDGLGVEPELEAKSG